MKNAGFKVVRMGDLSWDYFERVEGQFDFKTFDWIMDEMHAARFVCNRLQQRDQSNARLMRNCKDRTRANVTAVG